MGRAIGSGALDVRSLDQSMEDSRAPTCRLLLFDAIPSECHVAGRPDRDLGPLRRLRLGTAAWP